MQTRSVKRSSHLSGTFILLGLQIFAVGVGLSQIAPPGQTPPPPAQPGQLAPKAEPQSATGPATSAPAANDGVPDPNDPVIGRVISRFVLVPTTVVDKDTGGYINGLTSREFQLLDNDKPQTINSELSYEPLSVAVVIQANSEVEPMIPKLQHIGVLIQGLVTGDGGDVAILAFDHRQQVLQDFTTDPYKLDDAIHKLRSGSSTAALIDAVTFADRMLVEHDRANKHRRVVLLISRDVDKGSEMHLQEAARKMQFDNVIVYCVNMSKFLTTFEKKMDYPRSLTNGIPPEAQGNTRGGINTDTSAIQQADGNLLNAAPPIYRSIRDLFKKTPAEAFTQFTGGKIYSFSGERALETAVSDIGKDLRSQYLLSYSPNNSDEPGFHTIKVVVERPRLEIRTRPGYWWGGGKQ